MSLLSSTNLAFSTCSTCSTSSTSGSLSLQIGGMDKAERGRDWPALDFAIFGGALALYSLAMPLGLASVELAPQVAAGVAFDTTARATPLALLAVRAIQYVPLGDAPFRANLASAFLCACAVALVGRLCLEAIAILRPPTNARQEPRDFLHEPIAAAGAAFASALALAIFEIGSSAASAAATLVVVMGGLLAGFSLLTETSSSAAGYALAGIAGLAAGVDAVAGPLLWPPLAGMAVWSLRKGASWPLLAPLCFVAAWGSSALATVSFSTVPVSVGWLFSKLGSVEAHGGTSFLATALELCDELGVVGVILVAVGAFALATRATLVTAWLVLTLITSLLFAHSPNRASLLLDPTRAALPVAILVSSVFACAGLVHVSGKLGRARMAAALALAVILVISPGMDGGRARWLRGPGSAMRLLDRALARAQIRSVVFPGTVEMDGLFRLAHALGLRPDLEIGKTVAGRR